MKNTKSVNKKFNKKTILIPVVVVSILIVLGFMTKVGALPNYFDIEFLCSGEPEPTQTYLPDISQGAVKPVIYLYPENDEIVSVKLNYAGDLYVTYPEYNNGWSVLAHPDGSLKNLADNKEYSYLFWEGTDKSASYDLTTGFIVEGSDVTEFLQDSLSKLGLTPKEYNEFIVYWLPKMKANKYNLVHFATKQEYDDRAQLDINPKPDSILRIFMVTKKVDSKLSLKAQELKSFERKGFTVVEWGGTELN